jgi:hypothetical protein
VLAVAVILVLLAVPLGHQVTGHRVHLRLLRRYAPLTPHELRHASRPRSLRLAADLGWLAYLAGAVAVALCLRKFG